MRAHYTTLPCTALLCTTLRHTTAAHTVSVWWLRTSPFTEVPRYCLGRLYQCTALYRGTCCARCGAQPSTAAQRRRRHRPSCAHISPTGRESLMWHLKCRRRSRGNPGRRAQTSRQICATPVPLPRNSEGTASSVRCNSIYVPASLAVSAASAV